MGILEKQSDRIFTTAAAKFSPRVGFVNRISEIGETFLKEFEFPHWQSNAQYLLFRDPAAKRLVLLDHTKVEIQIFGFEPWTKRIREYSDMLTHILNGYSLKEDLQFTISCQCYLDVEMTFAEITDLFFGAFTRFPESTHDIWGSPKDGALHVIGQLEGLDVDVNLSPMNSKQVEETLQRVPNLRAFAESNLFDRYMSQRMESLIADCLYVGATVTKKAVKAFEIRQSMEETTRLLDKVATNVIAQLKNLPTVK